MPTEQHKHIKQAIKKRNTYKLEEDYLLQL